MTLNTLPISRLIQVSVALSGGAAQSQDLNNIMIVGSSTIIDVSTRFRNYSTLSQVAGDFGTSAPEYLAALLWFEQTPNSLLIGRWAEAATAAQLFGSPLTAAQQAIANFTAVGADGGFSVTIGGSLQHVASINLSAVTNLNGVASAINAELTGATCAWNSVYQQFVFTTTATGAAATITFLSAPSSGPTDISGLLGGLVSDSGAYVVNGINAESALAAVEILDNAAGQLFFGITVLGTADADSEVIAPYIEAAANFHYFGVTTQEAGVLVSSSTTDIAYILSQLAFNRTMVQYSSTNPYAVVSALGRIVPTNYAGNNTVIDLMYKQEPGIVPEFLTTSQIDIAENKNANVFVAYNNNTAIIEQGNSCSGLPCALVIGAMAFAIELQTALYNTLYGSSTKIPQTDAGMHILGTAIEQVATQFVNNGFLGPGTWASSGFGSLSTGDFIPKGYYLFTPPIAQQSSESRAAGQSVAFQLAAKFSGAVRTVDLAVTVNQ